jgi:hypothetical protein
MRRRGPATSAVIFVAFFVMFSVIFWPKVSMAAKLGFFAAGVGFGASLAHLVRRKS